MRPRDFGILLQDLLAFAQHMLRTEDEFHPFAAVLNHGGEVAHVAVPPGHEERTSADEHIDALVGTIRGLASSAQLLASGIAFDVRTIPPGSTEKTDAICVRLEHRDGEAVDVVLPYQIEAGEVRYGELFAMPGKKLVFVDP